MSITRTSRNAIVHGSPLRTLADVKNALQGIPSLTPRQRADLVSALNTLGWVRRLPGEIDGNAALARMEADPRLLTKYFARADAARFELKRASWNNLKFRIRQAVRITGGGPRVANRSRPLSPLWSKLFEQLPRLPYQVALVSFVRFLDARNVAPSEVTSAHLQQFERELHDGGLRKSPRATILAARYNWNKAADAFPTFWPQTKLKIGFKFDNRYSLPWSAFAPSFETEVKSRTAIILDPPLDDPNSRPAVRKTTALAQEYDIRRFASALVSVDGRDPKSIGSVADLVNDAAPRKILEFLAERVAKKDPKAKSSGGVLLASQLLCNLGANWVSVDETQLKRLRSLRRQIEAKAGGVAGGKRRRGITAKNRNMINEFRDEAMIRRFLALPDILFERLAPKGSASLRRVDAAKLAGAFAIALLQIAPVRPRNAARIELGKNLIEQGSGSSRRIFLRWEPSEVKNEVELEFELTGPLLPMLDRYVAQVRPRLCNPDNLYLFPGRGHGPKDESWFSTQLARITEQELGVRVTGQQFRHLIGYIYLLDNPGSYEAVRQFLGHTDIATTMSHYAGMAMQDAAQSLDATISRRRQELACFHKRSNRRGG